MDGIIDLTLDDEDESVSQPQYQPSPKVQPAEYTQPSTTPVKLSAKKDDDIPKPELKLIEEYEWIEIDNTKQEIDYVKAFRDKHKHDKINYSNLNIDSLDPNYIQPNSFRGNVIDKIMKSLAKDGEIKATKKVQDDYDVNDTFVDDSDNFNSNTVAINQITPAFDDFICLHGDIEQFKKSNYFDGRIKIVKKHNNEMKKKAKATRKAAKKTGKDGSKRRAEEAKPPEALKKVKKTPAAVNPPEANKVSTET